MVFLWLEKGVGSLEVSPCTATEVFDLSSSELLTNIEVIETEGVVIDGGEFWVKSYTVSTSNDSKTWTTYSDRSVTRVIF